MADESLAVRLQRGVALLYLPHELVHYLAVRPWTGDARIHLSVPRDARSRWYAPATRVTADIPPTMPAMAVRFAGVAPTLAFGALALVLHSVLDVRFPRGGYWLTVVPLTLWTVPSIHDVNTFLEASAVKRTGRFAAGSVEVSRLAVHLYWTLSFLLTFGILVLFRG